MNYTDLVKQKYEENPSIICMGMDPVLERIPLEGQPKDVIVKFFTQLLDGIESEGITLNTVKPNLAFYEQYGIEGLQALKEIMKKCKEMNLIIIGDAKRGDIGNTSKAYANALYDYWGFDAITTAPYMGSDSVLPFSRKGKNQYLQCRNSNIGAKDFQDLKIDGVPLYMKVAQKIVEWKTAAVVGATCPEELIQLSKFFVESGEEIPLLIPGVGTQGGSASDVIHSLKKTGNNLEIHRVNSSSSILYAYEKEDTDDFVGASLKALKKLNEELIK